MKIYDDDDDDRDCDDGNDTDEKDYLRLLKREPPPPPTSAFLHLEWRAAATLAIPEREMKPNAVAKIGVMYAGRHTQER